MPLLLPLLFLGSAGYAVNDLTGWIGRDDGTPPIIHQNNLPSSSVLVKNALTLGVVGVVGFYAYKKIKKS